MPRMVEGSVTRRRPQTALRSPGTAPLNSPIGQSVRPDTTVDGYVRPFVVLAIPERFFHGAPTVLLALVFPKRHQQVSRPVALERRQREGEGGGRIGSRVPALANGPGASVCSFSTPRFAGRRRTQGVTPTASPARIRRVSGQASCALAARRLLGRRLLPVRGRFAHPSQRPKVLLGVAMGPLHQTVNLYVNTVW